MRDSGLSQLTQKWGQYGEPAGQGCGQGRWDCGVAFTWGNGNSCADAECFGGSAPSAISSYFLKPDNGSFISCYLGQLVCKIVLLS